MRRPILLAAIAAMAIAAAPASHARSQHGQAPVRECANAPGSQQPRCPQPPAGKWGQPGHPGQHGQHGQPGRMPPSATHAPRGQHQAHRHAPPPGQQHAGHRKPPRIGTSAQGAQPFMPAPDSRFGPLPRGQEYRVADEHLVLVDSQTLRIVSVVGLLAALMR